MSTISRDDLRSVKSFVNFPVNDFYGRNIFIAEIECEEDSSLSLKRRLAVLWAIKNKVSLIYIYLKAADLSDLDLTGVDFYGTDLTGVNFTGSNLTNAHMANANLKKANFTGAILKNTNFDSSVLTGAILPAVKGVPVVENLDRKILEAIEKGGTLDMRDWHTCDTTHCRAGWAVALAGKEGYRLERKVGPSTAGSLIYAASRPGKPIPNFYASDREARADIKRCAAAAAE